MLVVDQKSLSPALVSPVRPALEGVGAYKAGMTLAEAGRLAGRADLSKLASNENLLGASPRVAAAVQEALASPEIYPDPYCETLRAAIGARLAVDPARIVMTPGSEALIDYLFRAVLHPGDSILLSSPTFPAYEIFGRCAEASLIDVPRLQSFDLDLEAFKLEAAKGPKLLVLCTPNNPTGAALSGVDLAEILAVTPRSTVVFIDEAYREYHEPFDTLALLKAWGGTWVSGRTFSKAAALAAWTDVEHLERTVALTIAERGRVEAALDALGVERTRSAANFVFLRSPAGAEATAARLLREGLIVRPTPVPGGWVRITIGRPADNDRLIAALPAALAV
jgi:histidinol-phosphate aminotransferase